MNAGVGSLVLAFNQIKVYVMWQTTFLKLHHVQIYDGFAS